MDSRVRILTRNLKRHDPDLFADRDNSGVINIMRKKKVFESYECPWGGILSVSRTQLQFIMPLTEDWMVGSRPVEWGIEPLMQRIYYIDSNMRDDYNKFCEQREERERLDRRALHNDMRARAADMRSDFAKVFKDINTSTMKKVDNRRKEDIKHGNSKS